MDGVETKVLVQAVRRNAARFPRDFAFRLTAQELAANRSQIVTGSQKRRRRIGFYTSPEDTSTEAKPRNPKRT